MLRRVTLLPVLFLALLLTVSCSTASVPGPTATAGATAAAAFPMTLTDFQDRAVAIAKRPERIVSIGPSNTEFLFALGAGERVVGDDDFSDEPAAAKTKTHVGGVKVNLEQVVALRPDLVVTVKFSDGTLEALTRTGATVLVVDPQGLTDVARTATLLGQAVGADGSKLAKDIQQRIDEVKAKTGPAAKPKVFHEIDASDPAKLYSVGPGSFIDDLINVAGGANILAAAKTAYPTVSGEEIIRADPEIIVLADAAYGTTVESVTARPGWAVISAVKNKKVFPVAGSLFSRPGPRVGDAALAYAKLLHPDLFK
ncbi:MAG TPA: helical backbone metal receptor [Candidatus Limnocylindria bacterium]|nr:helical backbone metal receptor [Candidatus Limnocylindria bacterium]